MTKQKQEINKESLLLQKNFVTDTRKETKEEEKEWKKQADLKKAKIFPEEGNKK